MPDHRLAALIGILIRCLGNIETATSKAAHWREVWSRELKDRVPGMLDLRLDEVLQDDNDVSNFKQLLQLAKKELRTFGMEITAVQLRQLAPCSLHFVKGLETSNLESDIDRIAALLCS